MTREELIRLVALKMDEISSSDDVITDVGIDDNNPLYTQIDSLLNESVNEILTKAPLQLLSDFIAGEEYISNVTKHEVGKRYFVRFNVPDDFLRFVSIEDPYFLRPITELSTEGDDIARRQHNKHLVAREAKPVAVLKYGPKGRFIDAYSYAGETKSSITLLYIPVYNGSDITDEYMIEVASWVCAGKVFSAQGDITKGKACDENAVALME